VVLVLGIVAISLAKAVDAESVATSGE